MFQVLAYQNFKSYTNFLQDIYLRCLYCLPQ